MMQDDELFATLARVKESLPVEAMALAAHIRERSRQLTNLAARLAEREAHWQKWDDARVSNIHELHERANKAEARLAELIANSARDHNRWATERLNLAARQAEAESCIDLARRFMCGEIVNDQGEAWDQCLRTLDGYGAIAARLVNAQQHIASAETECVQLRARLAEAQAIGQQLIRDSVVHQNRLAEAERDAVRYRWVHDNVDWIDDTGYVINTLHPDAQSCAMFQWGVDAALTTDSAPAEHRHCYKHNADDSYGICECGEAFKICPSCGTELDATGEPPPYVDPEPIVTYGHANDKGEGVRFRQYKKDPLPPWAVDVRDEPSEDEMCWHRSDDPKGCYRVRCQLSGRCINDK